MTINFCKHDCEDDSSVCDACRAVASAENFMEDVRGTLANLGMTESKTGIPAEGRKDDKEKIRLELLPTEALEEVAKVLTFGAIKYGDHNWRGGMAWSRLLGAVLRHIFSWVSGNNNDSETKLSHLAHANCCLLFLLTYELKGLGTDDRRKQ